MSQIEAYVEGLFAGAKDETLERVLQSIRERGMPEISVHPSFGRLLTLLASASGASSALEIGALGGYSAICIARGLRSGGRLISLELKEEFAELARANVAAAGFGDQVSWRIGEALKSLEELSREGETFDFFFIDADKGNYPQYLDWAMALGKPGAWIIADNTLLKGRVADPAKDSPSVAAMRKFNERIVQDPRLEGVILPAFDGLAIARLR